MGLFFYKQDSTEVEFSLFGYLDVSLYFSNRITMKIKYLSLKAHEMSKYGGQWQFNFSVNMSLEKKELPIIRRYALQTRLTNTEPGSWIWGSRTGSVDRGCLISFYEEV